MSLLGTRSPQTASFSVFTALTNSCGIFLLCSVPLFGKHQVGEQGSGLSGRKRLWGWESSMLWGAGNEVPYPKPSPALPKTLMLLVRASWPGCGAGRAQWCPALVRGRSVWGPQLVSWVIFSAFKMWTKLLQTHFSVLNPEKARVPVLIFPLWRWALGKLEAHPGRPINNSLVLVVLLSLLLPGEEVELVARLCNQSG